MAPARLRRAAVFQEDRLCGQLSAVANVRLGAPRGVGRAVGDVRSAGPAPTVGRPVALAVLETSEIEVGRQVEIDGRGARVTTHPAYDPEKLRPRL